MTTEYTFQAEISQLLNIIINSLYSNKEITVRELLSNSSDSLNKLKYQLLTNDSLLKDEEELFIRFIPNKENNTLTVWDSGVGMTRDELVNNLGTIAKSGTKAFVQSLVDSKSDTSNMIGQFGVGFYSSFLLAGRVEVLSRPSGQDTVLKWTSDAGSKFSVEEVTDTELKRGTKVVLHLKKDCDDFMNDTKLNDIIKKYSQFSQFPMYVWTKKTREEEEEDEDESKDENDENNVTVEEVDDVKDDTEKKKKTKHVEYNEFVKIDNKKPLWLEDKENISNEDYLEFYKSLTGDWDEFCTKTHFKAEGTYDFSMLLFVAKRAPFDMFSREKTNSNVSLYVRRVFITNDCREIVPEWLTFVKGVVDSNDLPLNVSRELLQESKALRAMKKQFTKKCIAMFEDLQENNDKYKEFYGEYHKNLKLGAHEDSQNRQKLLKLLRFVSVNHPDGDLTLEKYVAEMKEGQNEIYYITGTEKNEIAHSPFLEGLNKKGYDTLLMFDPIDEYLMGTVKEFENKKFRDVTKEGLKFNDTVDDTDYTKLHTYVKNHLGEKIGKVVNSDLLHSSPCALTSSQYGMSANMQNIMKAQTMGNKMAQYMMGNKVLELNVGHKLIKHLDKQVKSGSTDEHTGNIVDMLYDTALLTSGYGLESSHDYARKVHNMLCAGLDLPDEDDDVPQVNNVHDTDDCANVNDTTDCANVDDTADDMETVD